MADKIFPTQITDGTPASDDRLLFSDTSASNATKDCAISELPVSDATTTALNLKVDKTTTVNGEALTGNITLTQDDVGDGATYKQYSQTEKTKLAGIETGAQVNTLNDVIAGTNVTINKTDPLNPVISAIGGSGSGDVVGPASATDGSIALFDTTTGKKIKDSAKIIVTTLGADDTTIPTSKAVKDYADNKVSDTAYDATSWDGVTTVAPSKNAVRDKVFLMDVVDAGKKNYHGVVSRATALPLPTNTTTTTFTLSTGTTPLSYWRNGVLTTINTNKSVTHSAGAGIKFIYFTDDAGTLTSYDTFQGLNGDKVYVATVDWNGTNYGIVNDERHGYDRDIAWHTWAHSTIGTRYGSGLTMTVTGTGATSTGAVTSGNIYDEDINFTIGAQTTFRQRYQTGATTSGYDTSLTTTPVKLGANNRPGMVDSTSYVWTQVGSAVNRYVNYFVYASTTMLAPIHVFSETAATATIAANGYTSLANARAVPFPNISYYGLSAEFKPLYRIICRADGVMQAIDITQDDYRTTSSIPFGAGNVSTTASAVSYTPTSPLTAVTVQTAIDEVTTKYTPVSRTLTINGTALDLSADRSWTIAGSSSIRRLFTISGTIGYTGTNVANTWLIDGTYTISKVNMWYDVAGNGTLTVDINKNGTTLFSTTKPSITGTNQYSVNTGTLTTTSLASGDLLTIDIDAVPGTPGTTLYVEIIYA